MQKNRLNKNNKGVTLIEVIAVVAVLGVVMAAVTGFMITGTKMSARVSDTAKDSMQDQTTVEFIQKLVLECSSADLMLKGEEILNKANEGTGYYPTLEIKFSENSSAEISFVDVDQDGINDHLTYVYTVDPASGEKTSKKPIELCSLEKPSLNGFLINEETNTLTYYLNDEKHVVHLRVTKQP